MLTWTTQNSRGARQECNAADGRRGPRRSLETGQLLQRLSTQPLRVGRVRRWVRWRMVTEPSSRCPLPSPLPDHSERLEGAQRHDDEDQQEQRRDHPAQGRVGTSATSCCYIFVHVCLLSTAIPGDLVESGHHCRSCSHVTTMIRGQNPLRPCPTNVLTIGELTSTSPQSDPASTSMAS